MPTPPRLIYLLRAEQLLRTVMKNLEPTKALVVHENTPRLACPLQPSTYFVFLTMMGLSTLRRSQNTAGMLQNLTLPLENMRSTKAVSKRPKFRSDHWRVPVYACSCTASMLPQLRNSSWPRKNRTTNTLLVAVKPHKSFRKYPD